MINKFLSISWVLTYGGSGSINDGHRRDLDGRSHRGLHVLLLIWLLCWCWCRCLPLESLSRSQFRARVWGDLCGLTIYWEAGMLVWNTHEVLICEHIMLVLTRFPLLYQTWFILDSKGRCTVLSVVLLELVALWNVLVAVEGALDEICWWSVSFYYVDWVDWLVHLHVIVIKASDEIFRICWVELANLEALLQLSRAIKLLFTNHKVIGVLAHEHSDWWNTIPWEATLCSLRLLVLDIECCNGICLIWVTILYRRSHLWARCCHILWLTGLHFQGILSDLGRCRPCH